MKFFRIFNNIRVKLFLTYFILIVFNISLMGYLFYYFTRAHFMTTRKEYLATSADYFINFVSPNIKFQDDLIPATRFFIRQYWEQIDYELVVVNASSEIISDSRSIDARVGFSPFSVDNDKHVQSVLQNGKAVSWVENVGENQYVYQCNPVFLENKVIGAVKLAMSTEDFSNLFTILKNYFFITFIWSLIAALLLALFFIKTLMNPVTRIRDMAMEIAHGNFENRLKNYSSDELGDLSRNINKMADELKKLEQTRNAFLANVSHELRTPLTIIKGFAMTMMGDPGIDDTNKNCLETINKEVDRLTRLVNELLELSRIKTGRFSLNMSECSITDLIDFVVFQMTAKAQQIGCKILVNGSDNLPKIQADPDRIKEVLINLIDNALKYSTAGTSQCAVTVSATHEDSVIKIIIKDSGPGIPKEELSLVFERFFRGGSRGQKIEGVGLGLAIVKEIVTAHEGKIYAESPEGEGCSFIIELPLK